MIRRRTGIGNGLRFVASSPFAALSNPSAPAELLMRADSQCTLEFVLRTSDTITTRGDFFEGYRTGTGSSNRVSWWLFVGNQQLTVRSFNTSSEQFMFRTPVGSIKQNSMAHVAIVKSGVTFTENTDLKVYINGVPQTLSVALAVGDYTLTTHTGGGATKMTLGRSGDNQSTWRYAGLIVYRFRYFTTDMTAAQVSESMYGNTPAALETDLYIDLDFDQTRSQLPTLFDKMGNCNMQYGSFTAADLAYGSGNWVDEAGLTAK